MKWPTLEGRLSQPLTTTKEALEQLEKSVPLTEYAKNLLKKETFETAFDVQGSYLCSCITNKNIKSHTTKNGISKTKKKEKLK